uniref:Uncharacterized protein n=1 Tax=Timema poppense TaxID=170557 RepID=A0A7R9DHP3_TIMPO|nr:unnamed protein product [Timema poppensis]
MLKAVGMNCCTNIDEGCRRTQAICQHEEKMFTSVEIISRSLYPPNGTGQHQNHELYNASTLLTPEVRLSPVPQHRLRVGIRRDDDLLPPQSMEQIPKISDEGNPSRCTQHAHIPGRPAALALETPAYGVVFFETTEVPLDIDPVGTPTPVLDLRGTLQDPVVVSSVLPPNLEHLIPPSSSLHRSSALGCPLSSSPPSNPRLNPSGLTPSASQTLSTYLLRILHNSPQLLILHLHDNSTLADLPHVPDLYPSCPRVDGTKEFLLGLLDSLRRRPVLREEQDGLRSLQYLPIFLVSLGVLGGWAAHALQHSCTPARSSARPSAYLQYLNQPLYIHSTYLRSPLYP